MIIKYNVTGKERKRLVKALSEILMYEPEYTGAPTFAYKVGNYLVDRNGTIECPSFVTEQIANCIIELLEEDGFNPAAIDEIPFSVGIPKKEISPEALFRLRLIVLSKATLFKRAFKSNIISVEESDDKIIFPWFTLYGVEGETKAYADFILALCDMAKERKRIIAKPYEGNNDKFYMRLFLVQLGLKGDEHKQTRKILLRFLTGNSAWRDGVPTGGEHTK